MSHPNTDKAIKVAVIGAAGRMGRMNCSTCIENSQVQLTAAIEHQDSPFVGKDIHQLLGHESQGLFIASSLDQVKDDFEVVIDFTHADVSINNAKWCAENNKHIIIGTTGFNEQQKQLLHQYADQTAIVQAPNMSVGVNLFLEIVKQSAKACKDLYDIEIIEAHHKHKVDAPSGTALAVGEVVAEQLGRNLNEVAVYERYGQTGAREDLSIGFQTIRGGDVVGDHTLMYLGDGERIELKHQSTSRASYAKGAVSAAIWLNNKEKGLFNMQDVLGLS